MRAIWIAIVVAGLGGLAYWWQGGPQDPPAAGPTTSGGAIVTVALPASLSPNSTVGQTIYTAKCADCHGENAAGRNGAAPPLVHKIYEPSHHGDEAFQRAVAVGVRQHHWSFGDMAPVEGLTRGDAAMVIAYIRELQRANGIE